MEELMNVLKKRIQIQNTQIVIDHDIVNMKKIYSEIMNDSLLDNFINIENINKIPNDQIKNELINAIRNVIRRTFDVHITYN
jgi:alanine-alpha-ketoisovalerate/valine-pyruvate aminotransferase